MSQMIAIIARTCLLHCRAALRMSSYATILLRYVVPGQLTCSICRRQLYLNANATNLKQQRATEEMYKTETPFPRQ
jgi:hypothetical protein